MAASSLLLSSEYKASVVFSEINPVPPYFLSLKILWKGHLAVKVEKNHRSDFELKQFLFWNSAHLGHLFRQTPKIVKFNRWSSLKNMRNSKLNHIYCVSQFLREKRHKIWNQECKQKQSLTFDFCNIFDL